MIMDAKDFFKLCNSVMQDGLTPVSAFGDTDIITTIEDDLDTDLGFSQVTDVSNLNTELFTAGMPLPECPVQGMQLEKKNMISAGIQDIQVPYGKHISFVREYLPFGSENNTPVIAMQILDWLYQIGHELRHGDDYRQVVINSCSSILGDGLSYEQTIASYAAMRFGLYMPPADFMQLENIWSNDLFSVISNPHRIVSLPEAHTIMEAMKDGYLNLSIIQRFALTPSICYGMLQCMKSGKILEDVELYCTSEDAMLGYLKLLLADRYSKLEYQQAIRYGTIIQYVNEVLSGNVDELTILLCRRNDWDELKRLLEGLKPDRGIIRKYCDSPYLQQILSCNCSNESLLDRFFSTQTPEGDRYISVLKSVAEAWSTGEFEWRALLQQDCAKWEIPTENIFAFGEQLAKLLVTAVSSSNVRESEYRQLLYWLSKGIDGFGRVLLESAKEIGLLSANEIAFIVVLEKLYDKFLQRGITLDLEEFAKTQGIGCALVLQREDKCQLYSVFDFMETVDPIVDQYSDCACVRLRRLEFQAGFVLQVGSASSSEIPVFPRMFSSEENWAASGGTIGVAEAFNLTKLNEKIKSAGYEEFPADFVLSKESDLLLDKISKSPELYGICSVKDLASAMEQLARDILKGLSNSEIWYRQLLLIVTSGGVKYEQRNITKETLQFFLPLTEVRIRCGAVRKMSAADALNALPSLVDFVKSRQLNLEIARSGKSDLVIQVT